MFRIGQKIECVDATSFPHLQEGKIYTCTGGDNDGGGNWIRIDCCGRHQPRECGWWASRFRPIVERKTDISIFTKMLKPTKHHADA